MRRVLLFAVVSLGAFAAACTVIMDTDEIRPRRDLDGGVGVGDGSASLDGQAEAGTGDFCTRSFAGAAFTSGFDDGPTAGWSRTVCEPFARIGASPNDGKPAPGVSVSTSAATPAGSFAVCWLEADGVPGSRTFRFGFDVKLATETVTSNVIVGRLDMRSAGDVRRYTMGLGHGPDSFIENRFERTDGGVTFDYDRGIGARSLDWVSYRVELAIGVLSDGRSNLTVCRDGARVHDGPLDAKLDLPTETHFEIGIAYTAVELPPLELRFDNAFLEVEP